STSEVFEKTMARLRFGNFDVSILPAWQDIDTLEDLRDLLKRHEHGDFRKSRTLRYLLTRPVKNGFTAAQNLFRMKYAKD
ncbi:MAG: hypothetical protein NTZ57_09625, partial [Deltaproteobacteria bacterium]|nr:hypothetical protein [Deltaproteobacteria bacterium]